MVKVAYNEINGISNEMKHKGGTFYSLEILFIMKFMKL